MNKRIVAVGVAAIAMLAAAAAAWHWGYPRAPAASLTSAIVGKAASGETLRKCRRGAQIEYTNGPCPAGTREEGVGAGTVTVLPAAPAPSAMPGSAAKPLLRELAGTVDPRQMQERMIDRAVGR